MFNQAQNQNKVFLNFPGLFKSLDAGTYIPDAGIQTS